MPTSGVATAAHGRQPRQRERHVVADRPRTTGVESVAVDHDPPHAPATAATASSKAAHPQELVNVRPSAGGVGPS